MNLSDNLPAGAENDINAPFNEEEYKPCPSCKGEGTQTNSEDCFTCDGKGEVPESVHKQLMKVPEWDR